MTICNAFFYICIEEVLKLTIINIFTMINANRPEVRIQTSLLNGIEKRVLIQPPGIYYPTGETTFCG